MSVSVKGNPGKSKQTQPMPPEEKTVRGGPNFMGVRHVGLLAKDPASLAVFYREVMGMKIVRQTPPVSPNGAIVFLARHPEAEDHDVVFVSNPTLAHTAFRVASLGELLVFYRRIKEQGYLSSIASTMASSCPSTSKTRRGT
jgi:catechol-2,3-dioxygenase